MASEYRRLSEVRDDDEAEVQTGKWWTLCRPGSNVVLLSVVFVLFGAFAASEMVAALASNSISLLEDAMSMVVDSATYVLNMAAERKKDSGVAERTRLKLEFYIPLCSVAALVAASAYGIVQATKVIASPPEDPSTGDTVMLVFASINLIIDIVSIFCFASVNRLLGYESLDADAEGESDTFQGDEGEAGLLGQSASFDEDSSNETAHARHKSNTNMCSAYTHVLADTLRSLAVMTAALVSKSSDDINADVADAWAAIVVSCIIFGSILPLMWGLKQKYQQLYVD